MHNLFLNNFMWSYFFEYGIYYSAFSYTTGILFQSILFPENQNFSKGLHMYAKFFKRFIDVSVSLLGLIILAVPMLAVALIIRIDSKGPVFFKQKRIGFNQKEFYIYKFRSMCIDAESMGSGVYSEKGDSRVTKIGKILRATSIDELPQFINILRGDMSFIGPRPPLTYHPWPIEEYTEEQLRMFDVRPGITGWAQVNGRKGVEWNHRIELNVWYVDNLSFLVDLKIFFLTIFKVFTNADNENTGATVITYTTETLTEEAVETTNSESVV